MFYLLFPVACRLFRRERFLILPLIIFVVLGPFARSHAFNHNPVWREYSYLGGMDAIALGCLTALFLARRHLSRIALWTFAVLGGTLLIFSLCFSIRAYLWGLGRNGLNMTILAAERACMLIAVAAQAQWQAPRILTPLLRLGRRSYEIYLTHIFIVLTFFSIFIIAGKPLPSVPALFIAVILTSALLGEVVARAYSEPTNRWLRHRSGDGPENWAQSSLPHTSAQAIIRHTRSGTT